MSDMLPEQLREYIVGVFLRLIIDTLDPNKTIDSSAYLNFWNLLITLFTCEFFFKGRRNRSHPKFITRS